MGFRPGFRRHRSADGSYADTGVRLLRLANGAHDDFVSQGSYGKRALLQLVVSNSSWKEGRLAVELNQPFDSILNEAQKARQADAEAIARRVKPPNFDNWRRGRDLNLNGPVTHNGFRARRSLYSQV